MSAFEETSGRGVDQIKQPTAPKKKSQNREKNLFRFFKSRARDDVEQMFLFTKMPFFPCCLPVVFFSSCHLSDFFFCFFVLFFICIYIYFFFFLLCFLSSNCYCKYTECYTFHLLFCSFFVLYFITSPFWRATSDCCQMRKSIA